MTLRRTLIGITVLSLTACVTWWWMSVAADYKATNLSDGWEKVSVPALGITVRCPPNWRYSRRQDAIEFQWGTEPDVEVRCFTGKDGSEYMEGCTRLSGYRRILINGKSALCHFVRGYHFGWDAGYVCRFIVLKEADCVHLIQCRVRSERESLSSEREAELDELLGSIETSPIDEHLTYVFDDPNGRYSFSYPRNWHVSGLTSSSVGVGSDWPGAYINISADRPDEKRDAIYERSVEDLAKDFSGCRWQPGWRHDYVIVRPNGTFRFAITMGDSSRSPRMDDTLQVLRSISWHAKGTGETTNSE